MLSALYWLGFALAASPGPDFFLILRHSLTHGRRMGYVTLAGNRLSLCLHMTFAILGLSVILQQSTTFFAGVRLLGAAYLIGALFLLNNFRPDLISWGAIARYWPLILIVWGALRLIELLMWRLRGAALPARGVSGVSAAAPASSSRFAVTGSSLV